MKFGVIVFPGSNCDHDAYHVISKHVGQPVDFIWHRETDLSTYDAVILPGGFSYGDYLRAGALARFSPVMNSVKKFAESGRFVLGICNGFQILCEAGLLPGALIRNRDLHFICEHVYVRVETSDSPFTNELKIRNCAAYSDRARRRQLHLRRQHSGGAPAREPHRVSLLRDKMGPSPTPRTQTARVITSQAFVTANATCSV